MNLRELIQHIPTFIANVLQKFHQHKGKNDACIPMIGKFYLGLNYDY